MMNGGYLVPANAKKGTLYFNLFRGFDLGLFLGGVFVSFFCFSVFHTSDMILTIIFCMPACICGLLVFPIPNYHNVLCAIQSIIRFCIGQRSYKWKGWCFYEQFGKYDGEKR